VAKIVGRETAKLNREGVCRATIETVAENMVDGITAPLFYAILASCLAPVFDLSAISCSVVGAFLYKAVNTMDSMIAYKNEKYLKFGRAAARLDDAVNFIPARLSGLCLIVAAFFLKLDYRGAARVFLRDRLQHSSPNAGHTEAAAAGALGVRLGGPSIYFDKTVEKPYMGDSQREPVPADIKKTNRLVIAGAFIFVVLLIGLRILIVE
jgi:adenosylcobinamide-phosphate synthase